MFEKLLSIMPYNPGVTQQMAFYSRRMRQEASIRRTGIIFMLLAFMVQFFAVISPPALISAATGPSNDLVNGGFSSAAQAASDCNNNVQDYKNILANYDISCQNVANSPTVNIASTDHNRQLFSMGRWQYGLTGEQPARINGSTYYVRFLWAWDKGGPASHYKALRILAKNGTLYYLLYACGNIVSVGVPSAFTPPAPAPQQGGLTGPVVKVPAPAPPKLQLLKTTLGNYPVANTNIAPGTTLGYKVYIGNSGGSTATNVHMSDIIPVGTTFVSQSLNAGAVQHTYNSANRTAEWAWSTIPVENSGYSVDLVVKVNPSATNGQKICNTASIIGSGLGNYISNTICHTVVVNAPPPVLTPTPPPTDTPLPTPTPSPTPTPTPVPVCQYDSSLPANSPDCKPCKSSNGTADTLACVIVSKTAANMTQNVADANNTTAQPGDVIQYSLNSKNDSKATISQYSFQENLSDVLIYADPVDLHGGTLDKTTGAVTWPSVNIAPGAIATEVLSVKVKSPVPALAVDPSNPGANDYTMTNVFGNTINIHVPAPAAQAIVTASATLPNTGPGSGLFLIGVVVMVAGYFYGRSRLLAKESAMAIKETAVV